MKTLTILRERVGLNHRKLPKDFTFMKELDKEIKKAGFTYIQVFADTSWFIYSQHLNGQLAGHIVFKRQENSQFNCVSFPGDNAFGIWAWQTWTLDRAKSIING